MSKLSQIYSSKGYLHDDVLCFIPKTEIESMDEYCSSDPYGVEKGFESSFQTRRSNLTKKIISNIKNINEPCILDVGCGEGHITHFLSFITNSQKIFGCDYSISAIKKAIKQYPEIDFCVANAYQLPYNSNSFDLIVCNNLWEHLENPMILGREMSRVLKKDGYVLLTTPSRFRIENFVRSLFNLKLKLNSKLHVTEYTSGQVIEQFNFIGFKSISVSSSYLYRQHKNIVMNLILNCLKFPLTIWTNIWGYKHIWENTVFFLFQKQ